MRTCDDGYRSLDARTCHPRGPPPRDLRQAGPPLWRPRSRRRVAVAEAPTPYQQSRSTACSQSHANGSLVLGLITTLFVSPRRIPKFGALVKPATLFKFHKALVSRKYRLRFSSSSHRRPPDPKGPSAELIAAIVEMKRRHRPSRISRSRVLLECDRPCPEVGRVQGLLQRATRSSSACWLDADATRGSPRLRSSCH